MPRDRPDRPTAQPTPTDNRATDRQPTKRPETRPGHPLTQTPEAREGRGLPTIPSNPTRVQDVSASRVAVPVRASTAQASPARNSGLGPPRRVE